MSALAAPVATTNPAHRPGGGPGSKLYRRRKRKANNVHWCTEYSASDWAAKRWPWKARHKKWMSKFCKEYTWYGTSGHPCGLPLAMAERCAQEIGGCDRSSPHCGAFHKHMRTYFQNYGREEKKKELVVELPDPDAIVNNNKNNGMLAGVMVKRSKYWKRDRTLAKVLRMYENDPQDLDILYKILKHRFSQVPAITALPTDPNGILIEDITNDQIELYPGEISDDPVTGDDDGNSSDDGLALD